MHGTTPPPARRLGPRIANVSAEQLPLPHSLRHVDLDPPRQRMQNTACSKAASCLQVIWGQASGLAVFMPRNSNIPNRREQECISKQRRRCGLLHLCDIVSTGPSPRLCSAQKHQAADAAGDATSVTTNTCENPEVGGPSSAHCASNQNPAARF